MKKLILVTIMIICIVNNIFGKSLADIINKEFNSTNDNSLSSQQSDVINKYISTSIKVNLSNGTSFNISMMVPNGWIKTMSNDNDNPIIRYTSDIGEGEIVLSYMLSYKINHFDDELKSVLHDTLISKYNAYDVEYDSYKTYEDVLKFTFITQNQTIARTKIFFHNRELFMIMVKSMDINLTSISEMDYILNSMVY